MSTGFLDNGGKGTLSPQDQVINAVLQDAVNKSAAKKNITMSWPSISEEPISEFSNTRIFALAFPWLFPGGIGDIKDYVGKIGQWGEHMLFYQDARFASDKIFTFLQ